MWSLKALRAMTHTNTHKLRLVCVFMCMQTKVKGQVSLGVDKGAGFVQARPKPLIHTVKKRIHSYTFHIFVFKSDQNLLL